MSGADVIPPVRYGSIWLIVGVGLVLLVVLWYVLVWFLTRKRRPDTLDSAKRLVAAPPDRASVVARYQAMIDEVEQDYTKDVITARAAHQKLSYIVRFFVYEMTGRRAYAFTLSDIKKARLPTLEDMVEGIYPPEFASIVDSNVRESCNKARSVVSSWQ